MLWLLTSRDTEHMTCGGLMWSKSICTKTVYTHISAIEIDKDGEFFHADYYFCLTVTQLLTLQVFCVEIGLSNIFCVLTMILILLD